MAYVLLANVCTAVLVTAAFSRKFYAAISTTDTAAYYASATFPLSALAGAIHRLSRATGNADGTNVGYVALGAASITILAVFVALVRAFWSLPRGSPAGLLRGDGQPNLQ